MDCDCPCDVCSEPAFGEEGSLPSCWGLPLWGKMLPLEATPLTRSILLPLSDQHEGAETWALRPALDISKGLSKLRAPEGPAQVFVQLPAAHLPPPAPSPSLLQGWASFSTSYTEPAAQGPQPGAVWQGLVSPWISAGVRREHCRALGRGDLACPLL